MSNNMIRVIYKKLLPHSFRIAVRKILPIDEKPEHYSKSSEQMVVTSVSVPQPELQHSSNGWDRVAIANKYLEGDGIEIGALQAPLRVPPSVSVKYVDRMTNTELRKQYPELDTFGLVETDIIADGERLESIGELTQDFVIANHFIEHCENPLFALSNMFRVLKKNGLLYMAVPDKRFTFDVERPITTLDHILRDFEEGGEWSRRRHFEEWARFVNKIEDKDELEKRVDELIDIDYSIHFHVWTQLEMLEFVVALNRKLGLRFDLELFFKNGDECIFVLRKID